MKQTLAEWIEIREHNQKYISEIQRRLKRHHLNVNYYIDGNHLKLFLDSMIQTSNRIHQEIFSAANLGECPELPVNEAVYSELIRHAQTNLQINILKKLSSEFSKSLGVNLISDFDVMFHADNSIKLASAEEYFKTDKAKKLRWDVNSLEILEQSAFVNFFVGGGIDYQFLLNTLEKYWRNEANEIARLRIAEFIDDFRLREKNQHPKTETLRRQKQFTIFKKALEDFDSWPGLISEMNEGETRFDIHPKRNHLIEFHEKAVDTKLIMRCMDDLASSKDDDVFVFVTNDTDFLPLFERVLETRQLIWLPGAKRKSKKLEALVGKTRTFELSDFFLGKSAEFPRVPTTRYWDEEIIEPLCPNFEEIRHYYLYDQGYAALMRRMETDYEEAMRAEEAEFQRLLKEEIEED